jgi:hypothetical protein
METGESKKEDFWRTHLLKAQEFSGSDKEYCRVHGLTKGTFYAYKKRLGFTKALRASQRRSKTAFIKIEPAPEVHQEHVQGIELRTLPDPRWVAALVVALMNTEDKR